MKAFQKANNLALQGHIDFLHDRIFQTEKKWPHFKRLLDDLVELAESTLSSSTVVSLERAYIYGGYSLIAPLFSHCNFISIDIETETAKERGAYQASWLDDSRCIKIKATKVAPITDTGLAAGSADLLLCPNLVHHVRDQKKLFSEFSKVLKNGGQGYLFEALLRELHQIPDDYLRYTPWGFQTILNSVQMNLKEWRPAGGPFEAITYCWQQAIQYLPSVERVKYEKWLNEEHFSELLQLDQKYRINLDRAHTSFPVGYGIFFEKQ